MKAKDVELKAVYVAKVSGKLTKVRIDHIHYGYNGIPRGWDGTNLSTGRRVHIISARRLRYKVSSNERSK